MKKRQRRLDGIDEIVVSLTARGLTTGEIAAHFGEVYGAEVFKDTISRITDQVTEEMTEWCHRPLDRVYPVMFIDAISRGVVKVRDGQVVNRPAYVAIGVILGLWAGDGSEGAKFWLSVLTEIRNRGVEDLCMVVCDGLKRLPKSITTTWEYATVQACILHPITQHLPLCLKERLGRARARPQTDLHRGQRDRRGRAVRGVHRDLGAAVPGDHRVVALGLERVHRSSWTTTWRSASARPTRSSRSTPATVARSAPAGTSPPSRRR